MMILPCRTFFILLTCLLTIAVSAGLSACSSKRCTLCYEDEWSRTPFPGQRTQHIPPLDPTDLTR